jgi:hypothetical protein
MKPIKLIIHEPPFGFKGKVIIFFSIQGYSKRSVHFQAFSVSFYQFYRNATTQSFPLLVIMDFYS